MHHLALPGRNGCISTGQEVHVLLGIGSSLAGNVLVELLYENIYDMMWIYDALCRDIIEYMNPYWTSLYALGEATMAAYLLEDPFTPFLMKIWLLLSCPKELPFRDLFF